MHFDTYSVWDTNSCRAYVRVRTRGLMLRIIRGHRMLLEARVYVRFIR